MFVKPAKWQDDPSRHLVVRDPVSFRPLPETGAHVPDGDLYWHQRLLHGDVVLAEPPAEPAASNAQE